MSLDVICDRAASGGVEDCLAPRARSPTSHRHQRKQRNFALAGDFSGRRSVNTNQQKLSSNY